MSDLVAATEAVRSGRHADAERMLRAILASEPANYEASQWLGTCLIYQNRSREAAAAFNFATQGITDDAGLWYNLGAACQKSGWAEQARVAYGRALALDPGHTRAREALSKLGAVPVGGPAWQPIPVPPEPGPQRRLSLRPIPIPRQVQRLSWLRGWLLPTLWTLLIWIGLLAFVASLPEGHTRSAVFDRGPIPVIALFMFAALLERLGRRYVYVLRQTAGIGRSSLLKTLREGPGELVHAIEEISKALDQGINARLSLIDDRIVRCVNCAIAARSRDELYTAARDLAAADLAGSHSYYAMPHTLVWALPVSGFIGTILGMSRALSGMKQLAQAADFKKFSEMMGEPMSGLANAYDNTLVGLVLVAIAMFLISAVQRRERDLLTHVTAEASACVVQRIELGYEVDWLDAGLMVELLEGLRDVEKRLADNLATVHQAVASVSGAGRAGGPAAAPSAPAQAGS